MLVELLTTEPQKHTNISITCFSFLLTFFSFYLCLFLRFLLLASHSLKNNNTHKKKTIYEPTTKQISNEHQQSGNTTDFTVPVVSDLADLFTMNAEQFADGVSVFDQNLADLNDYSDSGDRNGARSNDTWNFNQLYAGLPLKDEPPELFDDNRFDPLRPLGDIEAELGAISTASTSNDNNNRGNNYLYGMLRHTESPTLNLSQVIEWSDYFSTKTEVDDSNETAIETATTNQQNETENLKNVQVKLEPDDDDQKSLDDCKNSTSGFSSNVELTEEVTCQYIGSLIIALFFIFMELILK